MGSYWYNLQFENVPNYFSDKKFQSHDFDKVGMPEKFPKEDYLDLNVPFLESQNKPTDYEFDTTKTPIQVIKNQLREDVKTYLWFLWKVFGGYKLTLDLPETYMERNVQGVNFNIKLDFNVGLDGKYKLTYSNKLKYDKEGLKTTNLLMRGENGSKYYKYEYDLSFEDSFEETGDMSLEYEDKEYLIKKYRVPNYIDMDDIKKYKVNYPRPENMRF